MPISQLFAEDELDEHKHAIYAALQSLKTAAKDYADSALHTAQEILELAHSGAPVASSFQPYAEVAEHYTAANHALAAYAGLANLLVALNDTVDDEAKEAYRSHLAEDSNVTVISALLEGATRRLNVANDYLPRPAMPTTRFHEPRPPAPPQPPSRARPTEPH